MAGLEVGRAGLGGRLREAVATLAAREATSRGFLSCRESPRVAALQVVVAAVLFRIEGFLAQTDAFDLDFLGNEYRPNRC